MTFGRTRALVCALALLCLLSSCGFVSSGQEDRADGVLGPWARDGTTSTTTTPGEESTPPTSQAGASSDEGGADGKSGALTTPQDDSGTPDDPVPVLPTFREPDPEVAATALASCRLVMNLQDSGTELLLASQGKAEISLELVQRVVGALRDLGSIVPPGTRSVHADLMKVVEPAERFAAQNPPDVTIAYLQTTMDQVAPEVTELLESVYPVCPQTLDPKDLDQAERIKLGQAVGDDVRSGVQR